MINLSKVDFKYWILVSLIYFTLIYSTSLSFAYLGNQAIGDNYLNCNISGDYKYNDLQKYYPDLGAYENVPSLQGKDFWKLGAYWVDSGYYLLQADNISSSIAPYKYRLLPTVIAGGIHKITHIDIAYSFVLMNIIFTYLIAILFTWFVRRYFGFSKDLAIVGGILSITIVGITTTLPFPMLEPAEYFFFLLVLISLRSDNTKLYIFAAVASVLSKELLIIVGILYFVNSYFVRKNANLIKVILLSALPFIIFSGTRYVLGGSPVEVHYGFNLLAGAFPLKYWSRILTKPFSLFALIFLSFSFLWLGLWNIKKDRFIYINTLVTVPLVIVACVLLSGSIVRIIGVVYPLIIILFLFFFKAEKTSESRENANRPQVNQ